MIQLILHTSRAPDLVSGELNILVRPGQLVSNSLLDFLMKGQKNTVHLVNSYGDEYIVHCTVTA